MYKSSSEKQSFISRVASHSTKGHANGRVDLLPAEAKKEEYYQDLKSQYNVVVGNIDSLEREIERIRSDLKRSPADGRLRNRLAAANESLQAYRTLKGELVVSARLQGEISYSLLFLRIAKCRLSKEALMEIEGEVKSFLGRAPHEIKIPSKQKRRMQEERKTTVTALRTN